MTMQKASHPKDNSCWILQRTEKPFITQGFELPAIEQNLVNDYYLCFTTGYFLGLRLLVASVTGFYDDSSGSRVSLSTERVLYSTRYKYYCLLYVIDSTLTVVLLLKQFKAFATAFGHTLRHTQRSTHLRRAGCTV